MDSNYDEEIVGEAPCEFCGELFPLMLLIEHESIHLVEDNYQFFDEDINNSVSENVSEFKKTEVTEEKHLKSIPEIGVKVTVEEKQIKSVDSINEPKVAIDNKQKQSIAIKIEKKENEKIKEITANKGEKLLVYGNAIDPDRDMDSDRQMYNMPSNPLLNTLCKEKDIEDINNLSDDDSSESLEEFWKRARDVLKRNRLKSEYA